MRYAIFLLLTTVLTALIGWSAYQTALLLRHWRPDFNLLLLPAENALRLALAAILLGLGLLSGLPVAVLGWAPADPIGDVVLGVVAGALLSLTLTAASKLAVQRFGQQVYSPLVILSVLPSSRREWVAVLLALGPAVAVEELLFRSLLLGGLSPLLPAWLLVAALAALFGLLHLPQGALGVVGTALAGAAFAGLFLWRGSLLAPLAAHYAADVLQLMQAERSRQELETLEGEIAASWPGAGPGGQG